jgi:hypothetical protein
MCALTDGRPRPVLPEFRENDVTVDPKAMFSPVTAPGCRDYGLDLNNDYTDSLGACRGSSSSDVT